MNRNSFLKAAAALGASVFAFGKSALAQAKDAAASAASGGFKITLQPYATSLTGEECFIIAATNRRSRAEVEATFPDGTVRKFYASHSTAGIKHVGMLHSIHVDGLKPGDEIKYKVSLTDVETFYPRGEKNLAKLFKLGETIVVGAEKPLSFKVPRASETASVAIVNDIHAHDARMKKLLSAVPDAEMLVMNGDMDNRLESHEDILSRFLATAAEYGAGRRPVYYVRGNHECRGFGAENFPLYAPFPGKRTYCAFRHGPVYFLMLDSCEMRPDNTPVNGGFIDLVRYQREEAKWLEGIVRSREFKSAPFRVAIQHIPFLPPTSIPGPEKKGLSPIEDYKNYEKFRRELFYENILKGAGIDLIINAHTHKFKWAPDGNGLDFPMFINSNTEIARLDADMEKLTITVFDESGKQSRDTMRVFRKSFAEAKRKPAQKAAKRR